MFGKKKWRNMLLIEGEKDAMLVARLENLPAVDHNFDDYPVDVTLNKKCTFFEAIRKAVSYSERNIYNMLIRIR